MNHMHSYSQNKEQDIILSYLENINLTKGTFLDIGAFDGEKFSNTRGIFLKYPDWKGIFVEPSSFCFVKLFELYRDFPRRAELVNLAVVLEDELHRGSSNMIEFHDSPLSAASSTLGDWGSLADLVTKNEDGDVVNPRKLHVGKIGMKQLLDTFGRVDFINIDVEGYSAALATQEWFNPHNYGCKLICVEQDGHGGKIHPEIFKKYSSHGFQIVGRTWENLIMGLPIR
jgi:FkbM family methyltransferase